MSVIAFDCAQRTGWAFVCGPSWVAGVVNPKDRLKLSSVIGQALREGVTDAVLEEPHLEKAHGNVITLKSLVESRTRVQVECERAGLHCHLAQAVTWRAGLGIPCRPRAEAKLAAVKMAAMLGLDTGGDHDIAEAVCMCEWRRRALETERRMGGAKAKGGRK